MGEGVWGLEAAGGKSSMGGEGSSHKGVSGGEQGMMGKLLSLLSPAHHVLPTACSPTAFKQQLLPATCPPIACHLLLPTCPVPAVSSTTTH